MPIFVNYEPGVGLVSLVLYEDSAVDESGKPAETQVEACYAPIVPLQNRVWHAVRALIPIARH